MVTAAVGVALSQAVATALRADSTPVSAVAAAVRDFTPGRVALFLIHLVGTWDKPLLLGGTTLLLLAICGYAASWVRRFPLVPDLVFFALAASGLVALPPTPEPGHRRPARGDRRSGHLDRDAAAADRPRCSTTHRRARRSTSRRRSFLVRSAWVVGGAAVLTVAGRFASSGRRHVEQARRLLRLPVSGGTVPAGASLGVPGIEPWRTPNDDFYIIHTALGSAVDRAGGLEAAHPRHGRPGDHDRATRT